MIFRFRNLPRSWELFGITMHTGTPVVVHDHRRKRVEPFHRQHHCQRHRQQKLHLIIAGGYDSLAIRALLDYTCNNATGL